MENMVFYAHSGLRFLVLLTAVIAALVLLWGWRAGRPFAGQSRAVTAVFTGALDLQVLLGILLVVLRPFYPALMGHIFMMLAAAAAAHALTAYGRKQADTRRAHLISFFGVALALVLILGGIMSIRPSPFHMTPGSGATAAATG